MTDKVLVSVGYIVVGWYCGVPYILDTTGNFSWQFGDGVSVKVYREVVYAKECADEVWDGYSFDNVKVYKVFIGDEVGIDVVREWENGTERGIRLIYDVLTDN